jgi:phosphate transport system protein
MAAIISASPKEPDRHRRALRQPLLTYMMQDPRTIPRAIRLILISRFLERVADHATNIADMVVYLVEVKMVRHTLA